ncbi:MAG: hypothetical protein IPK80_09830 [Nannocystis sp.]|nr:hypothetical protein [Nannocystis sp.]
MIVRPPRRALALALLFTSGLACELDDPATLCGVDNADVILAARIDDSDTNVRVELAFRRADGGGVARPFCADDEVLVNSRRAEAIRKPNGHTVFAQNIGRASAEYRIELRRRGEVHRVLATIPLIPLEVTAPLAGAQLSRAQPLDVAWREAAPDQQVTVLVIDQIDGQTCFAAAYEAIVADSGAHQVPASALTSTDAQFDHKVSCEALVEVIRLRESALEPLDGEPLHPDSRFVAATERLIPFTAVP